MIDIHNACRHITIYHSIRGEKKQNDPDAFWKGKPNQFLSPFLYTAVHVIRVEV